MQECNLAPSDELLLAIEEFNRGQWFQCHETLEELWVGATGELRDFYQGLLQLAVALHHWRNGNFRGAVILLRGGADLLRRAAPVCREVDVAQLITAAGLLHAELDRLGEERMAEVPEQFIFKVRRV